MSNVETGHVDDKKSLSDELLVQKYLVIVDFIVVVVTEAPEVITALRVLFSAAPARKANRLNVMTRISLLEGRLGAEKPT